mgnify:FL=1
MSAKRIEETGCALSEPFGVLSHEYRRRILMTVRRYNPQDEDHITSEAFADENAQDDNEFKHVKVRLYHVHLPKLADAGFIDRDPDSGIITRGPRFEKIDPLLRSMHDHQDELPDDWPPNHPLPLRTVRDVETSR